MNLRKAVDNLLIYDPAFDGYAAKFVGATGGSSEIFPVTCMDDLRTATDSFTNVRFLEVCLHGRPGWIDFASGGTMMGEYLGKLTHGKPFSQRNMRVLFDSCNIGEGAAGDTFMNNLAKTMLTGKGGIIGATTVKNVVFSTSKSSSSDVYMHIDNLSDVFGAKLKVKRYDLNGNPVAQSSVNRFGN